MPWSHSGLKPGILPGEFAGLDSAFLEDICSLLKKRSKIAPGKGACACARAGSGATPGEGQGLSHPLLSAWGSHMDRSGAGV